MNTEHELRVECLRAASGVTIARIAKGEKSVNVAEIAQEMYDFLSPSVNGDDDSCI